MEPLQVNEIVIWVVERTLPFGKTKFIENIVTKVTKDKAYIAYGTKPEEFSSFNMEIPRVFLEIDPLLGFFTIVRDKNVDYTFCLPNPTIIKRKVAFEQKEICRKKLNDLSYFLYNYDMIYDYDNIKDFLTLNSSLNEILEMDIFKDCEWST